MHNVLRTLKSDSLALLLSLWLTTAGIWHYTIEICPSNECLSYLNLSMKASHVLKPHQHLGDNLWLDSDADKPTIMQTWNQFTSLENCQGRFVFKSRFNFKGLRPTWHWPHPHFVVPARIAWSSMDPPEPPAGFITKPQILHQTQVKTQRTPKDGLKFLKHRCIGFCVHWTVLSLSPIVCGLLWQQCCPAWTILIVVTNVTLKYNCHQCTFGRQQFLRHQRLYPYQHWAW